MSGTPRPVPAYEGFAYLYDFWVESAAVVCDRHLPFYGDRYVGTDGPVAELGVGNGRLLIAAARRGKPMIGVDNSPEMLELCRQRAEQSGVADRVTLIEADFRDFRLAEPAALITIPFHSIGHLLTLDDKRAALRHVKTQLRPGGRLIFDHFVFRDEVAERYASPLLRGEFTHPETGRDALLWVNTRPDPASRRMRVFARVEELDGAGLVVRSRMHRIDFSWIDPGDTRGLLEEAGYRIEALYGDFERGPFTGDSQEQIWVAVNPV